MEMSPEKILVEDVGLSRNEAKIYLALLRLGSSTAGKIAEITKMHRSNVYDSLERLKEKGLVAHFVKDETKYFEAADPSVLRDLLKEKELRLEKIMPQLMLNQRMALEKGEAKIYEGLKAAKNIMNHMLAKNQPIYVYGVAKAAPELIGPFLENFHKRRIAKKIQFDHIYNTDAIERAKWLNKLPFTRAKLLPKEFDSPVATNICGDEVILILWRKDALVIQIKHPEVAKAYKRYFDLLWSLAKFPEELERGA